MLGRVGQEVLEEKAGRRTCITNAVPSCEEMVVRMKNKEMVNLRSLSKEINGTNISNSVNWGKDGADEETVWVRFREDD